VIPRVLHRIWRGGPMPAEFVVYGNCWRKLHPKWECIDWLDDAQIPDAPAAAVFARARELAPRDHLRFEADIMRLQLLWLLGGVYVDCDVQPLRPLDELLAGVECFASWSPHRGGGGKRLLTNAVMGAVPGHPFIGACLAGLPAAVERYRGRSLAQMVGPWHISRVYERQAQGVTVFPERIFSPQANRDRDRGCIPDLSKSYAWHKWATSQDRRK